MRYNEPHRAHLLVRSKETFDNGEFIEVKAWAVPRSAAKPEGVKYSLVYIGVDGRRILGYDNAEGKGHHRHLGDDETPVEFESLEALISKFRDEVGRLRGRHQ